MLLGISGLLAFAGSVNAAVDLSLRLTDPVISTNGSTYKWSYTAELQVNSNLRVNATPDAAYTHDFFVINDIHGYVPGTVAFTNNNPYLNSQAPTSTYTFEAGESLTGPTPKSFVNLIEDDASLYNVWVRLIDASDLAKIIKPLTPDNGGTSILLGTLTFESTSGEIGDQWSEFASQTGNPVNGLTQEDRGYVETPVAIPEPASLAALVPVALASVARRRR
jgi:hypothetical protein